MLELRAGEIGADATIDGRAGGDGRPAWTDEAQRGRAPRARGLAALAAIMERTDLDAVARQMVASYVREIPSYARLAPELLRGRKLDQARAHLALFHDIVRSGGGNVGGDLPQARSSAPVRLRGGVLPHGLLQAHRLRGVGARGGGAAPPPPRGAPPPAR